MGMLSKLLGISAQEAAQKLEEGAVLVDVRTPGEWAQGRAPQALHLPLARLEADLSTLDRDRPVVAVCRSGNRSSVATRVLRKAGFEAYNLRGGMRAWQAAGLPVKAGKGAGRVA